MKINDQIIIEKISKNKKCIEEISKDLKISENDLIKYFEDKKNTVTVFYVDGGSRGNPGLAGAGVVIDNNKKYGYYYYIGNATNNIAEYTALKKAIEVAIKKNISNISVNTDSELVFNQINGKYAVKSTNLIDIYNEVKLLIKKFNSFSLNYIPREKNKDADKLANLAMDLKKDGEIELAVAQHHSVN